MGAVAFCSVVKIYFWLVFGVEDVSSHSTFLIFALEDVEGFVISEKNVEEEEIDQIKKFKMKKVAI